MGGFSYKRSRNIQKFLRERDGDECWLCGGVVPKNGKTRMRASVDHVKPKSLGGSNERENLRLAHYACNQARGNKEPANWLWRDKTQDQSGGKDEHNH